MRDGCYCGLENSDDACINGEVYSYCSSEHCGGACEPVGKCKCECHTNKPSNQSALGD